MGQSLTQEKAGKKQDFEHVDTECDTTANDPDLKRTVTARPKLPGADPHSEAGPGWLAVLQVAEDLGIDADGALAA